MAAKLAKTTEKKKALKLISVTDSAIDWDSSYAEPGDLEDDDADDSADADSDLPHVDEATESLSLIEMKKAHYKKSHCTDKLKFKTNDLPTQFVFGHPHRVDVARKVREIGSAIYAAEQRGQKNKADKDMFTAVFHHFFLGTEEGFSGDRVPPPRIGGKVTDEYLQGLEDAEVFVELNVAFMRIHNVDRNKERGETLGK